MNQVLTRLNKTSDRGFTIVELMIATAVFSVVLLVVCAGVIDFTHQYYKGITSNKTQTVARDIANEVAQDLQFSAGGFSQGVSGSTYYICTANTTYYFTLGEEVESSPNGANQVSNALVAAPGPCITPTQPGNPPTTPAALLAAVPGAHELLGQSMRLGQLTVTPLANNLYSVTVDVIYGDNDLLTPVITGTPPADWSTEQCAGGSGDDFCATSQLTTTVDQRVQ